jgi:hypothetical protein
MLLTAFLLQLPGKARTAEILAPQMALPMPFEQGFPHDFPDAAPSPVSTADLNALTRSAKWRC